ncbi:MAG: hypothetical protein M3Y33_06575 [Actinomycetota bacterium]|nr:hypothetical protein [Actinomycetota bacterium]
MRRQPKMIGTASQHRVFAALRTAARFLASVAGDPLGLMLRIAVLRGCRRGELGGFRWTGSDLDAGYLSVKRPILQLGGKVTEGTPKSTGSERLDWLDAATVQLLREHRRAQRAGWPGVAGQRPGVLPRGRHAVAAGLRLPQVPGAGRGRGRSCHHAA